MLQSLPGYCGGKMKPLKASKKDKQECEGDAHYKQKQKEQVRALREAREGEAKGGFQVKDLILDKSDFLKKMSLKQLEHALRLLQINDSEDRDKGIFPEKNDLMMGLSFEELEVLSEFVDASIETSSEADSFDQNELEMLKQCGIVLKMPVKKSVASEEYPDHDDVNDYVEGHTEMSSQLNSLTPDELELLKECGFYVRIPNVESEALEEYHEFAS